MPLVSADIPKSLRIALDQEMARLRTDESAVAAVWRWGMRIGNAEMLAPLEAGSSRLRVLT